VSQSFKIVKLLKKKTSQNLKKTNFRNFQRTDLEKNPWEITFFENVKSFGTFENAEKHIFKHSNIPESNKKNKYFSEIFKSRTCDDFLNMKSLKNVVNLKHLKFLEI
jgi:hypothetical protein